MSEVVFKLDTGTARSVVNSKIREAIEEELGRQDIAKVIRDALVHVPKPQSDDPASSWYRLGMMGYSEPIPQSLLDQLVLAEIKEAAKTFVQKHMREQRPFIEDAFVKMLGKSEQRLCRSFAKAMTDAIDEADWGFDLEMTVKATEPERADAD